MQIGKITHYFPKIGVAVVALEAELNKGDRIKIHPVDGEGFEQEVESMQVEHEEIETAEPGQQIGMKVAQDVKPNWIVEKED